MSTSVDWQTERRLRALDLFEKGWQQKTIAEALGVTKGAISQWIKKGKDLPKEQQREALRVKKSTGRPPLLNSDQRQRLVKAVQDEDPEDWGFVGKAWTAKRVQAVARRELGVWVGISTIKNLLHRAGFSVQKPQVVATQKNEKAVAGFRGGWTNLKKGRNESERP